MDNTETIKLTQYSRGAGCGCKIAPAVLQEILKTNIATQPDDKLLVGNATNDDAAVYDLGGGQALIATTDFFTPVTDDAYDFGRIAAANAISDVYAMGGRPLLATAILGWPVEKLPAALAQQVLEGARSICAEAGIPLAGGHSVDVAEPIFGLSVNGLCDIANLKRNDTAKVGNKLFLLKPLGTGILSTAQKRELMSEEHRVAFINQLSQLNKIGAQLGAIAGVTAMTDVTGFGLAGHLTEMALGAGLSVELNYNKLQLMPGVKEYLAQRAVPDATYRNWNAYGSNISFGPGVDVMEAFSILPDPQTNGGLLVAVDEASVYEVVSLLQQNGYGSFTEPVGTFMPKGEKVISVIA
jgi:selenide,water dikinase